MTRGSPQGVLPGSARIAAWAAGVLLLAVGLFFLATYSGSRARQTRARQTVAATRETQRFQQARTLSWGPPDQSLWDAKRIRAWSQVSAAGPARAIAVLRIPRIGLEVPVLEGTDDAALDLGVGHIEGTPGPDAPGNVGIAGHRDGFFRPLKDVVLGDSIEIETPAKTFHYVVDNLALVDPEDTWVLDPTPSRQISLVTCFPFYYAGAAPRRYIVQAVESGIPR